MIIKLSKSDKEHSGNKKSNSSHTRRLWADASAETFADQERVRGWGKKCQPTAVYSLRQTKAMTDHHH
jgi:hypothetical protein